MTNQKTISAYVGSFPKDVQVVLKKIKQTIQAAAPKAEEAFKYGIPTFVLQEKNLVHFGAFKNHIGFYPTPSAIKAFAKELTKYKMAKGSIQFSLDKPMPLPLIKRMVKFRVSEVVKDGTLKKGVSSKNYIHRHKDRSV